MTTLALVVFVGLVLVIGLLLWNRTALMRFLDVGSAQLGKGARWAWQKDPVAILQDKIDTSAAEIAESRRGLEQYKGIVESLRRQVTDGTRMCADLDAKIKFALSSKNEIRATQYAIQLQREQEHLATNQKQLTAYDQGYQNNLKKIKAARDVIVDAKANAQRLGAELKMSLAEKEMANLASKFNIGTNLDGVGEVTDEIQRQIDANRAVASVQADLSADGIAELQEREQEKQEQARAILEKYKASMTDQK